jgi:hypothetical protein
MGVMRNGYEILVETPEQEKYSKDQGVDGKIILERIMGKRTGSVWFRIGISGGLL